MKKDVLADLLLFYSAKQQKMITLAEYVEAMPEDQKSIFYAAGEIGGTPGEAARW